MPQKNTNKRRKKRNTCIQSHTHTHTHTHTQSSICLSPSVSLVLPKPVIQQISLRPKVCPCMGRQAGWTWAVTRPQDISEGKRLEVLEGCMEGQEYQHPRTSSFPVECSWIFQGLNWPGKKFNHLILTLQSSGHSQSPPDILIVQWVPCGHMHVPWSSPVPSWYWVAGGVSTPRAAVLAESLPHLSPRTRCSTG